MVAPTFLVPTSADVRSTGVSSRGSSREALAEFGYAGGLSAPAGSTTGDGAPVLATPGKMQTTMQGFAPFEV